MGLPVLFLAGFAAILDYMISVCSVYLWERLLTATRRHLLQAFFPGFWQCAHIESMSCARVGMVVSDGLDRSGLADAVLLLQVRADGKSFEGRVSN